MAFSSAHNFTIETMFAVDERDGGFGFQTLVQEASLGAGHRSKERFNAPKCHAETRKAVIRDIMSWVDSEINQKHMLWMSGPAGAGKSSIAQTICDRCHEERKLLAAFFFSRTAIGTGRDDGNRLVPTIACQMATAVPETKNFIIDQLEKDPAVLSYSMEIQMEKLVAEPLSKACIKMEQNKSNNNATKVITSRANSNNFPFLVVIDGLDECNNPQMQSEIITMVASMFSKMDTRLRFFIASRPELEIRNSFETSPASDLCARIELNRHYKPDNDIRVYLQSEFATLKRKHTLRSDLLKDYNWPATYCINELVRKSSGQFIYASTVVKYLQHPRRDPRESLKFIITPSSNAKHNNALPWTESPYAQLDALYTQLLNAAGSNLLSRKDLIVVVFQVLLFKGDCYWHNDYYNLRSMATLASFLSMNESKLALLLSDLHSIMFIPKNNNNSLQFYHASFRDFLTDSRRSGEFHINELAAHKVLAHYCFTNLSEYLARNSLTDAERYSRDHYFAHIKKSGFDDELVKELYHAPRLRVILDLVIHPDRFISVGRSHRTDGISDIFEFKFHQKRVDFSTQINGKFKDFCDHITVFIDELILSLYATLQQAETLLLVAISDVVYARSTPCEASSMNSPINLRGCWLAMLLENPVRGRHLYLDSTNSTRLYAKFCSIDEFLRYSNNKWWRQPMVLKYLLERMEPSADIDTDIFREMSLEHTCTKRIMSLQRDEVDNFVRAVDEFIQKCSELAMN